MSRCPSCFTWLDPQWWSFRCTSGACSEQHDPQLTVFSGSDAATTPVVTLQWTAQWSPDQPVLCGTCHGPARQEVCSNCHGDLISGWRWSTTTCLALAGARASGKSIYIGVLVKQVERWCEQNGQVFLPVGEKTTANYKRLYETPLFEQRNLVSATPTIRAKEAPHRDPLIFQVGHDNGYPRLLVIRDVAGEDLEDPTTRIEPFAFFANADAVVFLFDPMRLQEITDQLQGVVPPQRLDGADPVSVLHNLVRLMRGGAAVGGARLRTPLALVLAKFDVLAELATVDGAPLQGVMDNAGASYNRDKSLDPALDWADLTLLQAEVRSLLAKLNARSLLNLVDSTFETTQTFAVSALGEHPFSSDVVSARGIAPFRVLDPVKWAMLRPR